MTRPLPLILAAACLAAAAGAVTIDSSAYQHRLGLPIPADGAADEMYALRLPDSLFAVTQDSLADVRIVDSASQAVPFDITRRIELTAATQRVSVAMTRVGFSQPAGENRIEITYEKADSSGAPQWLTLRTPLLNFEKSVTVEGSRDGKAWSTLVEGAIVFDASRYMDVSRKEVPLPAGSYRLYRIVLHDVTDLQSSPVSEIARYAGKAGESDPQHTDRQSALQNRDFRLDAIDFGRLDVLQSAARERIIPHAVTNLTITPDAKTQRTVVRFEAGRVPVTELTLRTDSRNFSRSFTLVAVYPGQRQDRPRPVLASGTLRRIAFRTLDETRLTVSFAESRAPAFALIIENGDNPELNIGGIELRGPEMQALFFAPASARLDLLAGSPGAVPPRFDLSAIRMALDRGLRGRLIEPDGTLQPNPDWKRSGGFSWNRKAFLTGALVVMVLILGFALYKATRKLEETAGKDQGS